MKVVHMALCALLLAGCVGTEMKASEDAVEREARQWCARMGIPVKGMECSWGGDCVLVTDAEVVSLFCYGGRCIRR